MRIKELTFLPTGISDTNLKDTKLDQLFVWDFWGMIENLKHIVRANKFSHRKNAESFDFNYTKKWNITPNCLKSTARSEIAQGKSGKSFLCPYVLQSSRPHHGKFVMYRGNRVSFVSSDEIRYIDPISKLFYRNFTITNCKPWYSNALELQNGSWNTYGRQLEVIDKPDDMPNHRVNVNWSSTALMEVFLWRWPWTQQDSLKIKEFKLINNRKRCFPGRRRPIWTWGLRLFQRGLLIRAAVARALKF